MEWLNKSTNSITRRDGRIRFLSIFSKEGLIFDGCLGKTQVKNGQFVYPLEFISVGKKQ